MNPTVLGIETSCDETAAAVWRDGIASSVVASQVALHARYGGVVPELASRAHEEKIAEVVEEALARAGVEARDLDGVAVTNRPGLIGALLVGLSAAKAVALAEGLPLVGVDHLQAHVLSIDLSADMVNRPMVCLLASGGHTALYESSGPEENRLLGSTTDDAAGEAFDKVAKLLGLPYPGGPAIEEAARSGDPDAVAFPRARVKGRPLDFSFSGIKTSVLYHLRDREKAEGSALSEAARADVAASFQKAVVRDLTDKTLAAAREVGARSIAVAGGVALNRPLQAAMEQGATAEGLDFYAPRDDLCGDNAAMVAALGARRIERGEDDGLALDAQARVIARGRGKS